MSWPSFALEHNLGNPHRGYSHTCIDIDTAVKWKWGGHSNDWKEVVGLYVCVWWLKQSEHEVQMACWYSSGMTICEFSSLFLSFALIITPASFSLFIPSLFSHSVCSLLRTPLDLLPVWHFIIGAAFCRLCDSESRFWWMTLCYCNKLST